MERKVAKLERKTQEAIHTLIRWVFPVQYCYFNYFLQKYTSPFLGQRLAAQKGDSDDIVGALHAQEKVETAEDSSDEEWPYVN